MADFKGFHGVQTGRRNRPRPRPGAWRFAVFPEVRTCVAIFSRHCAASRSVVRDRAQGGAITGMGYGHRKLPVRCRSMLLPLIRRGPGRMPVCAAIACRLMPGAENRVDAKTENTCPRCGNTFVCGMAAGLDKCWCAELPPIVPPDPGAGCLCPGCLRAEVASAAVGPGSCAPAGKTAG